LRPLNSDAGSDVHIKGTMKATLCLAVLALAFVSNSNAHDNYVSDYAETVSYSTPVVYEAPVVYQAPVNYYAPVYYLSSAAAAAVQVTANAYCPEPSTVIHITGGRGTYTRSNLGHYGSSVIVIGSQYARRDGPYRPHGFHHGGFRRHSWFR